MYLSRYLTIYPARQRSDHFLLYSTLRGSTAVLTGALLAAAKDGALVGPEAETLKRLGMLVDDPSKEREGMRSLLERANQRSSKFKALVVLNLDCNLGCGYCYEGQFRRDQYMSEATAQLLTETLLREHIEAGRDLHLTFYGGEPLLSEDLIVRISAPLQIAAKIHGLNYSFGLITNGTLFNRQTAERLIPLGLKGAKVTLDGPPEIHDRQRPYLSGAGSFDSIVANLATVSDLVTIMLGGNFLQENYREFPRMLDHLVERGIAPDRFAAVQFTPITPQAGCAEHSSGCASCNEQWLIEAIPFLREETLRRGFAPQKLSVSACVVELTDNVVVNLDGSLYKCPAFMGWEGFNVGTLERGLSDYTDSHGLGNWQRDACLNCPYLPLCFGGCRFLTLLRGEAMTEVDCRRPFFDATLEQLILQSIAYPPEK